MSRLHDRDAIYLRRCRAGRRFTPLFAERLEDRAMLAAVMSYQLHLLPPGGSINGPKITSVNVGQLYDLAVTVQDLRDNGLGVFSGYLDIGYDSSKTQVQIEELQFIEMWGFSLANPHTSLNETFTLTFNGQTTAPISYASEPAAIALAIQNALSSLHNIGPNNVHVTESPLIMYASQQYGMRFGVRFGGIFAGQNVTSLTIAVQPPIGELTPYGVAIRDWYGLERPTFGTAFISPGNEIGGNFAQDLPNLINDVGAYATLHPNGTIPRELVRGRLKATAPGTVTFTPSVADIMPDVHDTVMFARPGESSLVSFADIQLGPAAVLTINPAASITANADVAAVAEDATATHIDVLANDTVSPEGSAKEIVSISQPANGVAALTVAGVTYAPAANFFGTDTFTYVVRNGATGPTATATVTITVAPVNDAPGFVKGAEISVEDAAEPQAIAGWATAVAAGPPDESGQTLTFEVTHDNPLIFAAEPQIDATGKLTFAPKANMSGTATVSVRLRDNGGTASGGSDASGWQTFTIEVTRPFPLQNSANPLNVDGVASMNEVSPFDAILVINYLNATGGGPISDSVPSGPPYLDVNGNNSIGPSDAILVINWLNAHPPVTIEAAEGESPTAEPLPDVQPIDPQSRDEDTRRRIQDEALLAVLVADLGSTTLRKRAAAAKVARSTN